MSGDKFNNSYSRKDFLKLSLLAAGGLYASCNILNKNNTIPVHMAGANSQTGHLLRENNFPEPEEKHRIHTVIAGGGVAGLSAARFLKKNGFSDFILFEMDSKEGGNSKAGKNTVSAYPYAAHYIPIPNEKFTDLIDFLYEHQVITGFDTNGLPVYNEYHICAEPQERLYYRGIWQAGLPPKNGMTPAEEEELEKFIALTEQYKQQTGNDGKPAFTIPAEWSSEDEKFLSLDSISFFDFLQQRGYKTDFIYWFVDYCCKDDFGCNSKTTSAWAGMHYFCSRNGRASNAHPFEQLTWPEGNNFLVKALTKSTGDHIKTDHLVYKIVPDKEEWHCYVFDVKTNKTILYECKNVLVATPQFVNKYLFPFFERFYSNEFNYYPWLVANITIRDKQILNGNHDLAWDNVFYSSASLGYVNACHQSLNRSEQKVVLTFYYNFSEHAAKSERMNLYEKDEAYWKNFIIADLKTAHPSIENQIECIELYIHGHGMIAPVVGFHSSPARKALEEGLDQLHFINSDVSGLSIFEQAFYRGTMAAKKILEQNGKNS